MESIITTNLKDITLGSQFLTLKTPNGEIEVDIKRLLKEPINSDSAYFNATQVAKAYNKDIKDWMRNASTKEYISKRESILNLADSPYLKMVKTVRGKYHGGTWLHRKVVLSFLRWVDVDLEIAMDDVIENLIVHSNELKIGRDNTKILFKGLTETIRDIYIPNQESDNAKKFAFSAISTLVNMKVLGCMASKYAKDNNIEIEAGKSIRDYLSKEQLKSIMQTEEHVNGLIKYAKIYDYQEIKDEVTK